MSLAALSARSRWAAVAGGCIDSTPADTNATSGVLDTIASPPVITPGLNGDVATGPAAGEGNRICGRAFAPTAKATVSAHNVAMAPASTRERKLVCILDNPIATQTPGHSL